ncbi:hypothetical protein L1987_27568 [Smallanthus sonchifolius]|uniref:Uncharacterized protein n=1 Tax=Smallanthus sonchifolius TaxID=185202 RepID=A0ACB9ICT1_9ASTR|nr:hypothetical protein L1987_27568 [Smallanthus sonchifolius]
MVTVRHEPGSCPERAVYKSLLDPSFFRGNISVGGTTLVTMVGRGRVRTPVTRSHKQAENNTNTNNHHETNENANNTNPHTEEVIMSEAQFQDVVVSEVTKALRTTLPGLLDEVLIRRIGAGTVGGGTNHNGGTNGNAKTSYELVLQRFCPQNKLNKIEEEFQLLEARTMMHQEYAMKFDEMSKLVPHLVTLES